MSTSDKTHLVNLEHLFYKLKKAKGEIEDKLIATELASKDLAKEIILVSAQKDRYESLLKKAEEMIIERDGVIKELKARLGIR